MKEPIMDFRKCKAYPLPIVMNKDYVERVHSFNCLGADKKALQGVMNTSQNITGCPLPPLQDIANTWYLSRTKTLLRTLPILVIICFPSYLQVGDTG